MNDTPDTEGTQRGGAPLIASALFWLGLVGTGWTLDTLVKLEEIQRARLAGALVCQPGVRIPERPTALRDRGGREFLVRETLANMGQRLAADGFQRIHRRYIINLRRVEEVSAREVQLREGPRLPLGRSFRDAFRAALQQGDAAARPGP